MNMKIWALALVVVVVIVGTWYVSKHYNLSKLSDATGVDKSVLVAASSK